MEKASSGLLYRGRVRTNNDLSSSFSSMFGRMVGAGLLIEMDRCSTEGGGLNSGRLIISTRSPGISACFRAIRCFGTTGST